MAAMFKALSNPHRLEIFVKLASAGGDTACCTVKGEKLELINGPCACVGDLGKGLGLAPSTVSHHIKELRLAGLITLERQGQNIFCHVEPETLRELSEFFTFK